MEGVFVGSGIFKSADPAARAKAIVQATAHFKDPKILAEVSRGLGEAMPDLDVRSMKEEKFLATRGWQAHISLMTNALVLVGSGLGGCNIPGESETA